MNKRGIIIGSIVGLVLIAAAIGVSEFLSYKNISIVFKQKEVAIDIYSQNDTKITSASEDTNIKLKTGSYYYKATTPQYDTKKIYFEVKDDETVEISPPYSSEYLNSLLTSQRDAIQRTLLTTYTFLADEYIIGDEKLSNHGEWYSAKLIQRVSGGNQPDIYRVVLYSDKGVWTIAAKPQLSVSIEEHPVIPDYVIRLVNLPLSNEAYDLLYPE